MIHPPRSAPSDEGPRGSVVECDARRARGGRGIAEDAGRRPRQRFGPEIGLAPLTGTCDLSEGAPGGVLMAVPADLIVAACRSGPTGRTGAALAPTASRSPL